MILAPIGGQGKLAPCHLLLDPGIPGGVAGGGQVAHPVETGHLVLDDLGRGVFDGLRRGAGGA